MLDKLACRLEAHAKLFDNIETRSPTHVDKAVAILKLFTGNLLTEGKMSERGRDIILGCLGKEGFLTGYAAGLPPDAEGTKPNAQTAMSQLTEVLKKAGITAETGLRNIAA